ncbi:MAG: hypothetical protein V3V31_00665 [Methylococcales bacterium]
MNNFIQLIGNIAAVLGILMCSVAGGFRVIGSYYVFGVEGEAFFIAGIALMVLACLAMLYRLLPAEDDQL